MKRRPFKIYYIVAPNDFKYWWINSERKFDLYKINKVCCHNVYCRNIKQAIKLFNNMVCPVTIYKYKWHRGRGHMLIWEMSNEDNFS